MAVVPPCCGPNSQPSPWPRDIPLLIQICCGQDPHALEAVGFLVVALVPMDRRLCLDQAQDLGLVPIRSEFGCAVGRLPRRHGRGKASLVALNFGWDASSGLKPSLPPPLHVYPISQPTAIYRHSELAHNICFSI